MDVELKVNRRWKKSTYTIGRFYANGELLFNSLEDKDRGLTQKMPTGVINSKKVYGATAIPTGRYEITLTYSPKFAKRPFGKKYKGLLPYINKVKGYEGVRIHPGNTAKDTLGCVLVGRNTVVGKVTESTKCYYKLMDEYIVPAIKNGDKVWLTIE